MSSFTRGRLPIVLSAALGVLGVSAVMLASPSARASSVTPQTGVFNATIQCVASTSINGVGVCSQFSGSTASGDTGTGFAGVPDNTLAGFTTNAGVAIDPTQSGQSQTTGAINAYFAYPGSGPASVYSGGLSGLAASNFSLVAHAAVVNNVGQFPVDFSGTETLINAGATGTALTFFNDVNTLTGGSDLLSFSGTGNTTSTPNIFSYSLSLIPIVSAASVTTTTGASTAALLGGGGLAGGVTVTLTNPTTTGNLSASVLPYTAQQVANLENPAGAALLGSLNLAVLAPGGAAQVWNVSYSGNPGTPITLTFTYDPKLFGASFDPTTIEVGHISTIDGSLEVLTPTSVDPVNDTITIQDTTGFSDFVLLAPIPEPSTALLMGTGIVSLAFARRRRV